MKKEILFKDLGQDLIGLVVKQIKPELYEVVDTLIPSRALRSIYVGCRIKERSMKVNGMAILTFSSGERCPIRYPITEVKTIKE